MAEKENKDKDGNWKLTSLDNEIIKKISIIINNL